MDDYYYPECRCIKPKHKSHCEHQHEYKNFECLHCYPKGFYCVCKPICRKNLCDEDFKIRLGGMQSRLNYRLHQLLWCEVKILLENRTIVKGTISFVGSNFVEITKVENLPITNESKLEELAKVATHKALEIDYNTNDEDEEREHEKGHTLIFSIDKIESIELENASCHTCP